jgi:hypothetical protein
MSSAEVQPRYNSSVSPYFIGLFWRRLRLGLSEAGRSVSAMTTADLDVDAQLAVVRSAVDGLLSTDLSRLARDELLGVVRGFETESRRLVAVQHRLVAEAGGRNVAGELHYRDTAGLLSEMLLLTRGQANARVVAADSFGPRRSLGGEVLEPRPPAAATALAEGAISPAHATVIAKTIEACRARSAPNTPGQSMRC